MKTNSLMLAFTALPLLHLAAKPADPAVVTKATALLAKSDALLEGAQTAHANYTQIDAYPGKYRDLRQTATVTLEKPGELRIEITRARRIEAGAPWKDTGNNTMTVVSPGSQTDVFFHPHSTQVRTEDAPESVLLPEVPILNGFFTGKNTPAALLEAASADGSLDDVKVDGRHVSFSVHDQDRSVEIGDDGLIHKFSVHNRTTNETKTWTLDEVLLGPTVSPTAFRYKAPADAIPYDRPHRTTGLEVGSLAPDFQLADASGNRVHLNDLKGKVVLLKFWATWCWPCNQSLPETEALAKAYRSQGLETVAVAIKDSKTGFDAWVKKHPAYSDIRFAYEDPKLLNVSSAYRVQTTPTVYVIGRDGRIVTEITGFTGPNPALEAAIKSAQ